MHILGMSPSLFLGVSMLSAGAVAQEQKLSGVEIKTALSDHTLQGMLEDGKLWQQVFQKNGATFYSVGNAQSQGFGRSAGSELFAMAAEWIMDLL